MKWTVVYQRSAKDELTSFWLNAPDRQRITDAADEIDRQFSVDPSSDGESRDGINRVIMQLPLVMYYRVEIADRKVVVTAVMCGK